MPTTYRYPGIYVEEIPSGVRTITGVSTSDTAFVDVFRRGPVNRALRITSFGDFEREFGGVDRRSEASYAIGQFFLNGGAVAWVVRITVGNAAAATATLVGSSPAQPVLVVSAASAGIWGEAVEVGVDWNADPAIPNAFNLVARELAEIDGKKQVVAVEVFRNVSVDRASARFVNDVVERESSLIRVGPAAGGIVVRPVATGMDVVASSSLPPGPGGSASLGFTPLIGGTDGDVPDRTTPSSPWLAGAPAAIIGGSTAPKTGLNALDDIAPEIFSILCLPITDTLNDSGRTTVMSGATAYCEAKRAFYIIDVPPTVQRLDQMTTWMTNNDSLRHKNTAVYFPRLQIADPLNQGRPRDVAPSGTLAGVYARVDAASGVWRAPAGTDAVLRGLLALNRLLTDSENGALNPIGINVLRAFPIFGRIAWGSRTLDGADQKASEWKYIPIRRTALFIEESLYQALKWVVFSPNDEPLWAQIRLNVGAFMNGLFRQGAFQGTTPNDAYFVKCDRETTTQNDIDRGIVNILVGFAPLKPAEFVVIKIQQKAGNIET